MDEMDRVYRLMHDLRDELRLCPQTTRLAEALGKGENGYRGQTTRCVPKRDWIEAIEKGLPFVERAVEEQRRFIRTDREVVRIDRVRSVSPESVRHLAQHSDMIDHIESDGDVVPERLLVVEREENYAIYENRFLFTLISLLCDFVERRCRAYAEMNGSILFEASMGQELRLGRRQIAAQTRFNEEITPEPLRASGELPEELARLRQRVNALATTPLMQLLRGTSMVSPPIIRTNVIKKNANFQQALMLFEFLQQYGDSGCDGFAKEQMADDEAWRETWRDFCLLTALQERAVSAFAEDGRLAELKRRYEEENARREEEARREAAEREQAVCERVQSAWREEIALRDAEIAKHEEQMAARDGEIERLKSEAERLRAEARTLAQAGERAAEAERDKALLAEAAQTEARWMEYARRLEKELAEQAQKSERERQALDQTFRKALAAAEESHRQAMAAEQKKNKRSLESERESAERRVRAVDHAAREQQRAQKRDFEKRLKDERRDGIRGASKQKAETEGRP